MIYLDSAAVVKLVHAEPESAALRGWLNERARPVDQLGADRDRILPHARPVRAAGDLPPARRAGPDRPHRPRPAHTDAGRTVTPATVRSLDAIYLGTALRSRSSLTTFVTYDKRLLNAGHAAGLPIESHA
jgi:predicted nucleic acid-binding protein